MRILHVIGSVSPKRGGPSLAVLDTIRSLTAQGVEVDVATTNDDGPDGLLETPLARRLPWQGCNAIFFARQTDFYCVSLPLWRWLRANLRHYNLVHIHGLFGFVPVVTAFECRRARVPYVLTLHGILTRWGLSCRPRLKRLSIRLIESRVLAHAASIHFTSQVERNEADEVCRVPRSSVIPWAVDSAAFRPAGEGGAGAAGGKTGPVVLFLSRIDPVKRLDYLIRSFPRVLERHASATLVVAGTGRDDYLRTLKALAEETGIAPHVVWAGFVTGTAKLELLNRADLFALPSESENFGIAVAEAMACGIPVIVRPGVAIAEIVDRYGTGVVIDGSPDAFGCRMRDLLSDAESRQRYGDRGRVAASTVLAPERLASAFTQLYRSVCAS